MEDEDREKKGQRHPFLPPNYVTIVQLRERCLQEKERKQREKEREDEEERQRKLQLQKKLEGKKSEQKQKLGRRDLKGGCGVDTKPVRWNRKERKQSEEEREDEEERQRKLQLQKKLEEKKSERKQKLGLRDLKGGCGVDIKPVRWNRKPISPKTSRVVDVSPAKPEESEVAAAVLDTGNISAGLEQKGEEPNEEKKKSKPLKKKKKKKKKRTETKPGVEEEEQDKKEAEMQPAGEEEEQEKKDMMKPTISAKLVIRAKGNAPAKRNGGSKRTKNELKPKKENGDGAAEIERSFGHLSVNDEIERLTARADIHFRGPKTGYNRSNRQYRGHQRISGRRVWVRKGELSEGNVHAVQTFQQLE